MFRLSYSQSGPFLIHNLSQCCNKSNTTGVTCGTRTTYPSGALLHVEQEPHTPPVHCYMWNRNHIPLRCTVTCGTKTTYPSGALLHVDQEPHTPPVHCYMWNKNHTPLRFTFIFYGVHVARSFVFYVVFSRSLFVVLPFFCWSLHNLSSFHLQLLISPFVSLNFSCRYTITTETIRLFI